MRIPGVFFHRRVPDGNFLCPQYRAGVCSQRVERVSALVFEHFYALAIGPVFTVGRVNGDVRRLDNFYALGIGPVFTGHGSEEHQLTQGVSIPSVEGRCLREEWLTEFVTSLGAFLYPRYRAGVYGRKGRRLGRPKFKVSMPSVSGRCLQIGRAACRER